MPEDRTDEVVPGMAEAVEARRIELGLAPGEFVEASGLTAPGLMPVRRGYRRQYQMKVKRGVATALRWPPDAVDRLLAGEDPSTFPTDDPPPTSPGGTALPAEDDTLQLAALAGQLPPDKRAAIEQLIRTMLKDD